MTLPESISAGKNIDFDASLSVIKSFEIENYYWDFGDGAFENELKTRHNYRKPGKYTVRLGITGTDKNDPTIQQKKCASKEIVVQRGR